MEHPIRNQIADIINNRLTGEKADTFQPLTESVKDAVKAGDTATVDNARAALVSALRTDGVSKHLADRAADRVVRVAQPSLSVAG